MTTRLFSEAPNELNNKYRRDGSKAACVCTAVFAVAFSFGTAFAATADFRQAVISFLFQIYTERTLHEIDEGYRTASFDRTDTLCAPS